MHCHLLRAPFRLFAFSLVCRLLGTERWDIWGSWQLPNPPNSFNGPLYWPSEVKKVFKWVFVCWCLIDHQQYVPKVPQNMTLSNCTCYGYQHSWPTCLWQWETPSKVLGMFMHHVWTFPLDLRCNIDNLLLLFLNQFLWHQTRVKYMETCTVT